MRAPAGSPKRPSGLLGDAETLADGGPRMALTAGLVDEVADEIVSSGGQVLGEAQRHLDAAHGIPRRAAAYHVDERRDGTACSTATSHCQGAPDNVKLSPPLGGTTFRHVRPSGERPEPEVV